MIAYLSGLILKKTTRAVIVDIGGVGYEVLVPLSTYYNLPEKGEPVKLHIYTHVREDALILFGFHGERDDQRGRGSLDFVTQS